MHKSDELSGLGENKMSDLQNYINAKKENNPEFALSFDVGYENFKLGALLKEARLQQGFTQDAIAEKLHTKKTAISRIENHCQDIKLSTLEKFAEVLGKKMTITIS